MCACIHPLTPYLVLGFTRTVLVLVVLQQRAAAFGDTARNLHHTVLRVHTLSLLHEHNMPRNAQEQW